MRLANKAQRLRPGCCPEIASEIDKWRMGRQLPAETVSKSVSLSVVLSVSQLVVLSDRCEKQLAEPDMSSTMWRKLQLWAICAALCVCTETNQCPNDATSCCGCISTPGCSWHSDPAQPDPFCAATPSLTTIDRALYIVPFRLHYVSVSPASNKSIHQGRRRLIRPQRAQVSLALGARYELTFQVLALSTRQQIQIRYPRQSPAISLQAADPASCSEGLTHLPEVSGVRHRGNAGRIRGRGRERQRGRSNRRRRRRYLRYECVSSAPALIHRLRLVIDMHVCLSLPAVIRVGVGSGSKRLKVVITSDCYCPCTEAGAVSADGSSPGSNRTEPDGGCNDSNGNYCTSEMTGVLSCRHENLGCQRDPASPSCSGRGLCVCGTCMCDNTTTSGSDVRYYGQFCQCSDHNCPTYNGQMCGGPERGECRCGQCRCKPGFAGETCHMTISTASCLAPRDFDRICSGHGQCVSGRCQCEPTFAGQYCEFCPTCPITCHIYRPCVHCLLYQPMSDNCAQCQADGSSVQYRAVEELMESHGAQCLYTDANRCEYQFSYNTDAETDTTVVSYRTEPNCPITGVISGP